MRTERFTFLCSIEERNAISKLSNHYQRTQGDVIRFLIRNAVKDLSNEANNSKDITPILVSPRKEVHIDPNPNRLNTSALTKQ